MSDTEEPRLLDAFPNEPLSQEAIVSLDTHDRVEVCAPVIAVGMGQIHEDDAYVVFFHVGQSRWLVGFNAESETWHVIEKCVGPDEEFDTTEGDLFNWVEERLELPPGPGIYSYETNRKGYPDLTRDGEDAW